MLEVSDERFNQKRKEILEKIDRGEVVSNIELGMYDLTTYYDFKYDESLAEKILRSQNYGRRIQHIEGRRLYFMPEQEDLLSDIKRNRRIIVSAPTSFGKTLVIKEYIYREKPKNVVYIVPTNALAYEIEKDLKENRFFSKTYTVFDRSSTDTTAEGENLFFVGTQEKFVEISSLFNKIGLFVIDEAYKLQDGIGEQRGYTLSESFIRAIDEKTDQIVLLTPNAKLVGFEKYNFVEKHVTFNAVSKKISVLGNDVFYDVLFEKAKDSKTILFCDSPSKMVSIADSAETLAETDSTFVRFLEKEYHPEWSVVRLLKKGILTHHGQMPKFVQNRMVDLFIKSDKYNLLVGTNSISEGINTPTRNLFFDPSCTFNKEALLYKNTIGRAGRLGKYPVGYIYSTNNKISEVENEEVTVTLEMSKDSSLKEIQDNLDPNEFADGLKTWGITNKKSVEALKSLRMTKHKLDKMLQILKLGTEYRDYYEVPSFTQQILGAESYNPYNAINDRVFIRGCFQSFYFPDGNIENDSKPLKTFSDRIAFYKDKTKDKKISIKRDSDIIEGYMMFMYSSLEYKILPIMSAIKAIKKYEANWYFGKNIVALEEQFFKRYYGAFYGFDVDEFEESQKRVLDSLREYGISIKDIGINKEMVDEIKQQLKTRYSTFDVVNAIRRLSSSKSSYKTVYRHILNTYFQSELE